MKNLPIAIIGGGPIGLAAAAHLTLREMPFVLFEAGGSVGHNFLSWQHVRVFSPWSYNIDKAAERLLAETGWIAPDKDGLPTGGDIVHDYLIPLYKHPSIEPHVQLNTKVLSIGRQGLDKMKTANRERHPFSIKVQSGDHITYHLARGIIDATGTWNQPNPIGSGGVNAEGEETFADQIFYGIPDVKKDKLEKYKNKNIAVVGGGHSAINVLLDLAEVQRDYPKTQVNWILRKDDISQVYGGQQGDALAARGALGVKVEQLVNSGLLSIHTPFHILKLSSNSRGADASIDIHGDLKGEPAIIPDIDEVISNTGSRPDFDIIREIRTDIDAALESVYDLAELIDPNIHSCGTVRPHGEKELRHPEQNFYIVGSKSYGRAPTFLMATGYEQVRSIVAYMAGDTEAAERVELDLPQTGVCSSKVKKADPGAIACCDTGSRSRVAVGAHATAVCC